MPLNYANHSLKKASRPFGNHLNLLKELLARDIAGRYKGSMLGVVWAVVSPAVMLSIYTFVFSVVFQAKWSNDSTSKTEFALILFLGLIVFNMFAEVVSRAPSAITSNPNYVKKVIFPLEILTVVHLGSAMFQALISLFVWGVAYSFVFGMLPLSALAIPLVFINLLIMLAGMSWFLSSLGVFLRDTAHLVSITVSLTLFLSPIFYPVSAIPEDLQFFIYLNPLTTFIELLRQCVFTPGGPELHTYLMSLGIALGFFVFGYSWFKLTRREFADVL